MNYRWPPVLSVRVGGCRMAEDAVTASTGEHRRGHTPPVDAEVS